MWLSKEGRVVLVPDSMADTITRCLSDGWVQVDAPQPPQPEPVIIIQLDGQEIARQAVSVTKRKRR